MKRICCFLIALLLLLLVSCGGKPVQPGPVSEDRPLHPEEVSQTCARPNFVETADGIYYESSALKEGVYLNLIFFAPSGQKEFFPLCGKPNCLHDSSDCNAYNGFGFGYYEGHFYSTVPNVFDGCIDVVRMNLDGTDHKVVTKIDTPDGNRFQSKVHRGKMYILLSPDGALPLMEQIDRLIVLDLETMEQSEPFVELFTEGNAFTCDFQNFYEDKIYINALTRGPQTDLNADSFRYIELDTTTGGYRDLFELPICIPYIEGGTCYYVEMGKGFRERRLDTGEIREIDFPTVEGRWALYDKDYIYLTGVGRNSDQERTLYFLTRDYQLVDQIDLTDGENLSDVSSARLYFSKIADMPEPFTACLDKSQIGSGKLELQPITVNG